MALELIKKCYFFTQNESFYSHLQVQLNNS